MHKTLTALILCLAVLSLTDCQKSAADISSGTYAGENLTVFQDSTLFAKPDRASVTVEGIDGSTIILKMDSLITGFPSVTATCTADKDGSSSDAKVTFSGEGQAGSSETVQVSGYTQSGRMSLNFRETVRSDAVGRWMLAETEGEITGMTVPDADFEIYYTPWIYPSEDVSKMIKPLVRNFFAERSPYYDNLELTSDGRLGINYKDYHAEAVLPRDSVDALWGQSIYGLGTPGDFFGTGSKGLIRYYLNVNDMGVSLPNSLIAILNAFLKIYEIPFTVPIPLAVPMKVSADQSKLDMWIDETVLNPVLAESYDTIVTTLRALRYDDVLEKIPEAYREKFKEALPENEFYNYKVYVIMALGKLIEDETEYAVKLSFIPYEKKLRPWE